jgi:hypothetical protein
MPLFSCLPLVDVLVYVFLVAQCPSFSDQRLLDEWFAKTCSFRRRFEKIRRKKLQHDGARQLQEEWSTSEALKNGLAKHYGGFNEDISAEQATIIHLIIIFDFCIINGVEDAILSWFKRLAVLYANWRIWKEPVFLRTSEVSSGGTESTSITSFLHFECQIFFSANGLVRSERLAEEGSESKGTHTYNKF